MSIELMIQEVEGLAVRELDLLFKAANGGKSYGFDPSRNAETATKELRIAYLFAKCDLASIRAALDNGSYKVNGNGGKATYVPAMPAAPAMPSAPVKPETPNVNAFAVPGTDPASQLAAAIQHIMGNAVSEERVRGIVDASVSQAIRNHTAVHEIRCPELPPVNVGSQHKRFAALLKACNARLRDGSRLNIWLAGPAGSGKTSAAHAVAKALSLPFYSNGALILGYQVTGFVDASGRYHTTAFREAWEHGGVYLFDEIDASAPNAVIELNTALANGAMTFPDRAEQVPRHKDCVILAGANTFGRGATGDYNARAKQDEAFLSRFVMMDWPIDEAFERQLCGNVDWVSKVQAARGKLANAGIRNLTITPRATFYGEALIAAGFSESETADMVLRQGAPADVWSKFKP